MRIFVSELFPIPDDLIHVYAPSEWYFMNIDILDDIDDNNPIKYYGNGIGYHYSYVEWEVCDRIIAYN